MDREKVIKGLGIVSRMLNEMGRRNEMDIVDDAIAMLKKQEKEIENLKEIIKKADYTLEIAKDKINDLLKKTEGW